MPDSPEYQQRIRAYTENKDFLAMQREAPAVLAELVDGVPEETLRRPPRPGKWSISEILAHMAEDEVASYWRYRQMIEHPGIALSSFDQDQWARLGDYSSTEPEKSLELFRLLREANLRMLERLTPDEWQQHGVHAERGKLTVQQLARHMAGHDSNHIEQIRRILER